MDPGNWITSIQGGALYSYLLLSVILISSLIAILLQVMCAKLGIVTGMDLAQATKALVGKRTAAALWVTTELAIIATEIAEVIGSAIALNLLFKIPLLLGVIITVLDVFLLLALMKFGIRKIEALVFTLIATIFIILPMRWRSPIPTWRKLPTRSSRKGRSSPRMRRAAIPLSSSSHWGSWVPP